MTRNLTLLKMTKKTSFVFFILILGSTSILLYATLTKNLDNWGGDFAAYIMQAKSIVEFAPLRFIEANRFTIEQSSLPLGPIAYPWGFPVLLAPIYAIFGLNLIALKMAGVLSYMLFLGVLWYGFQKVHSHIMHLCLFFLFALNPTLLWFSNYILSDLPFLFLSTLSVVMIGWIIVERRQLTSQIWDLVLLGVIISVAFFIRSNGALLLITLGFSQITLLLKEQSRKQPPGIKQKMDEIFPRTLHSVKVLLKHLIPYFVFFSLIVIWGLVLPEGGGGHVSRFKSVSLPMIINHLYYYSGLPSFFFSGVPYHRFLYVASIPFAVAGMTQKFRSAFPAIIYSALTVFLFVLWPDLEGLRFLFPILPFYISFVLSGFEMILKDKDMLALGEKRFRMFICFAPVFAVILCFGITSTLRAYNNLQINHELSDGPLSETSQGMFAFIAENTEETSTVIFFKPRIMRLFTDRKSVLKKDIWQISRGDYLCLSLKHIDSQVSIPEIRELSERGLAQLVFENSDFLVYSFEANKENF
jgi:hypothetical protein